MSKYKTKLRPKKTKKFPIWTVIVGVSVAVITVISLLSRGNSAPVEKAQIEVTGAPAIRVDKEILDYGDVKLGGSPITAAVKVTNVGDKTLVFAEAPYIDVLEGC